MAKNKNNNFETKKFNLKNEADFGETKQAKKNKSEDRQNNNQNKFH